MPNREKVIEGLEETEIKLAQALDRSGAMSVMGAFRCLKNVKDALALLKEQEEQLKRFELERSWDENPDRMGNW